MLERPLVDQQAREAIFLLALIAVLWYMHRQRKDTEFAAGLLDEVFGKYNSAAELERELKADLDITVNRGLVPESQWSQQTMSTFEQAAYGEDEPDISHLAVAPPPCA